MFKCQNCGNVFATPDERCEDVGGINTEIGHRAYLEYHDICPECGADEIENAVKCDICGEYEYEDAAHITDDMRRICENCYYKYYYKEEK